MEKTNRKTKIKTKHLFLKYLLPNFTYIVPQGTRFFPTFSMVDIYYKKKKALVVEITGKETWDLESIPFQTQWLDLIRENHKVLDPALEYKKIFGKEIKPSQAMNVYFCQVLARSKWFSWHVE